MWLVGAGTVFTLGPGTQNWKQNVFPFKEVKKHHQTMTDLVKQLWYTSSVKYCWKGLLIETEMIHNCNRGWKMRLGSTDVPLQVTKAPNDSFTGHLCSCPVSE